MIESVLIANRGEIAARIARACRDLGIRSIAVFSDADAEADHVRLADDAVRLGPAPVHESYLSVDRLLAAAAESGAAAVHPGYGLLSENPDFAARVTGAGLVFVGPDPTVIRALADKRSARRTAEEVGLCVLPARPVGEDDDAVSPADEIGFPLLVKAAFGGGGRGMRVVRSRGDLPAAIAQARGESRAAFGHAEVYLERFLPHARHVEVQVVGDTHGTVVHLGTRDCTTQRRNQKLMEEAPAFDLPGELREQALAGSVRLARTVGYHGAATVEFLFSPETDELFFLEVNTRLQVEHTVTEMVTGIDIVATQLAVASGDRLPFRQDDVTLSGCAIEARLNAEDVAGGFLPQTGAIERLRLPGGPWIRVDAGVAAGSVVTPHYDSLLAKVAAWGPDRDSARRRLVRALGETEVAGPATTSRFLTRVLDSAPFRSGEHWTAMVDTGAIDTHAPDTHAPDTHAPEPPVRPPAPGAGPRVRAARIDTPHAELVVDIPIPAHRAALPARVAGDRTSTGRSGGGGPSGGLAPMDAVLVRHTVAVGDAVAADTTVAVVESMKMETHIASGTAGTVTAVHASAGESLRRGQPLVTIEPAPDAAQEPG